MNNPLINKGINHWASRRVFRVGWRKRGRREELGAFWMEIVREQDVAPKFPVSMADLPGFTTGGFRFNMAYKIRILVVVPRD